LNIGQQQGRAASRRVALWAGILVIASLAAMCLAIVKVFDSAIQPELTRRSELIATYLSDDLEHALSMGVPLDALGGIDQVIQKRLVQFPEVDRIAILDTTGHTIAEASRAPEKPTISQRAAAIGKKDEVLKFSAPIFHGNSNVGEVSVATNLAFMRNKMRDVVLDVLVVALVAILLGFELAQWVVAGSVAKPYDRVNRILREQAEGQFQRIVPASSAGILRRIARRLTDRANDLAQAAGRLERLPSIQQAYFVDVRLPLFLFSTATEISGSFLPIYARDAGAPDWLSPEMAATAPLITYLVAMAIVAPFGPQIVDRFGPRRMFLTAVPLTALASIGIGLGHSTLSISAWVGGMAFFYALATTACHTYVIRTTPPGQAALAMSSYLFVIIAGAFCGSALGGVMADRIGQNTTFFFGAVIALIAALLGANTIIASPNRSSEPDGRDAPAQPGGKATEVLFNYRFIALVFGIAVPANLGMSVFIWYVVPVMLEQAGARSADIGRVIMLYYLIPLIIGPAAARMADGRVGPVALLVIGMGVSGVALSLLGFNPGFWQMVAAVAAFGLGGAMCEVSQHAQAMRIAEASRNPASLDTGLAVLRLLERVAAIAGLLLSASLAARLGYSAVITALGVTMLIGTALVFLAESASWLGRVRRKEASRRLEPSGSQGTE
jgi:MFS family permease